LSCRPCHKPTCRMEHHLCMRDITADRVVALTMQALR
jgi:heptosyltransferase-2